MYYIGVQITPCKGANFSGKDMPGHARRQCELAVQKMTERIEMPFGLWTRMGPRQYVLHGAYWRNLANAIEPSARCGDSAFLSNYFDH